MEKATFPSSLPNTRVLVPARALLLHLARDEVRDLAGVHYEFASSICRSSSSTVQPAVITIAPPRRSRQRPVHVQRGRRQPTSFSSHPTRAGKFRIHPHRTTIGIQERVAMHQERNLYCPYLLYSALGARLRRPYKYVNTHGSDVIGLIWWYMVRQTRVVLLTITNYVFVGVCVHQHSWLVSLFSILAVRSKPPPSSPGSSNSLRMGVLRDRAVSTVRAVGEEVGRPPAAALTP